jgi:hypothetical protein
MDHQFQEFWGNLWLQMVQGQKQWDGLTNWWQKGFPGFNEWNAMMTKAYGLQFPLPESPDKNKAWEEALQMFQKSFQETFNLFGYVPRADYERLQRDYDLLQEDHQLLKKKSEFLEETIRQLQTLLAAQTMDPAGMAKPLKDLISEQTNQFQRFMSGMIPDLKKPSSGEDEGQ